MEDVIVIGGGIAGLTAAYRLHAAGRRVLCLEASSVAGGCVRTEQASGYRCEHGAQNFLEAEGGPVHRLARDLGIGERIEPARHTEQFVARGDALLRLPRQLPRVLSPRGLTRALFEVGVRRADGAHDESVAAWARRRFGREAGLRVIDPMLAGNFAGDPERLSMRAAFPLGAELERQHRSVLLGALKGGGARRRVAGFDGGMGTLTRALAAALGPALRLRTEVLQLARAGDRYRVKTKDRASGAIADDLTAAHVVVATPAPAAAMAIAPLDGPLARLLERIPYAGVVSVWLAYAPEDFARRPPAGYGLMRPHCDGARAIGCIFCSSLFDCAAPPEQLLFRLMFGGRRDADALTLDDAALVDLARRELAAALALRPQARPAFAHVARQDPGLPQYELGHLDLLDAIERSRARHPQLHLVGSAYRGVPVSRVVEQAERVVDQMLRVCA